MLQDQHPGKLHTKYKYIPHTRTQIMNLLTRVGGVQHKGEVNSSISKLTYVNNRMTSDLFLISHDFFSVLVVCVQKISNITKVKSQFFFKK